jgi:hypothetical protein
MMIHLLSQPRGADQVAYAHTVINACILIIEECLSTNSSTMSVGASKIRIKILIIDELQFQVPGLLITVGDKTHLQNKL